MKHEAGKPSPRSTSPNPHTHTPRTSTCRSWPCRSVVPTHRPLCTTDPPKQGHHRSLRTLTPPQEWALSRDDPSLGRPPSTNTKGPRSDRAEAVGGVGAPSTSGDPAAYLQSLEAAAAATYHHVPLHFSGLKHRLFLHFRCVCVCVYVCACAALPELLNPAAGSLQRRTSVHLRWLFSVEWRELRVAEGEDAGVLFPFPTLSLIFPLPFTRPKEK